GGGAATYAAVSSGNGKTVVRQVTVNGAQPTSSDSNLSVQSIYRLAYKGVVEITASPGQGSGFVYDGNGHIVTNAHVVEGASSVSVKFWNGKSYTAQVVGIDASTDLAVLKVNAPVSASSCATPLRRGAQRSVRSERARRQRKRTCARATSSRQLRASRSRRRASCGR